MLKIFSLIVLTCAVTLYPLQAESTVIVSLSTVATRISAQNPDLAAARLRIQEALGRMNQSGRLDNPEISSSLERTPRFREGRVELGISQRFPFTERLRLEKQMSLSLLHASEAEVLEVQRQLIGKARELIVQVMAARQSRALLKEQSEVSMEFAAFLSEVVAKGEGSVLDAGQARLDAASLSTEIRQLSASEAALLGELKPLLGMRTGESLKVDGLLPEPLLPPASSDPALRPDFQAAKLEVQAAAQAVSLQQARRYDDVEGGIFTAAERMEDAPNGYNTDALIGLRFSIALPFWNKNEGAIQEAQAKQKRKELEAVALERGIRLEADAARKVMVEWAELIAEINTTLMPLAEEQRTLAETTYRNGQGEIQSVLRTREKRLQLAISKLDALREFHLARVRRETILAKP